jgi:hypothetical protein
VSIDDNHVADFGLGLQGAAPGTYFLCVCPNFGG